MQINDDKYVQTGLNSLDRLCFFWIGLSAVSICTAPFLLAVAIPLALVACLMAFLHGKRASALFIELGRTYPNLSAWERFKLVTPLTGLGL